MSFLLLLQLILPMELMLAAYSCINGLISVPLTHTSKAWSTQEHCSGNVCHLALAKLDCSLVPGIQWQCELQAQDVLALGAIFATTDSVAVLQVLDKDRSPILFSLVFGEGVINDAAGVALLRAIQVQFNYIILQHAQHG